MNTLQETYNKIAEQLGETEVDHDSYLINQINEVEYGEVKSMGQIMRERLGERLLEQIQEMRQ